MKTMKINIDTLDKKVLKIALEEEIERQSINREIIKSQINCGIRFDGDENLILELNRLELSFKKISRKRKPIFEISDEELMFLERMIKNQMCISNSRINDWKTYFKQNKDILEEKEQLELIRYDENILNCMKELTKILNHEKK